MNNTLVQLGTMKLAGIRTRTTNVVEAEPNGKIPELWGQFFHANITPDGWAQNPQWLYGLYTDYESDASGEYTFMIGFECSVDADVDTEIHNLGLELDQAVVPSAKYKVFETRKGPVYSVIAEAWGEIWSYFETAEEQRTFTGDFELYDTRNFDPENTVVKIYIAVK